MLKLQRLKSSLVPPGSMRGHLLNDWAESTNVWDFLPRAAKRLLRFSGSVAKNNLTEFNVKLYQAWIIDHEPDMIALVQQRRLVCQMSMQPLISIVMPVCDPPPEVLRAAIESVLAQTYENWELCLADGASDAPEVVDLLEEIAVQDARVHLLRLETNQGISGNANEALSLVSGEFVAFLDHDDLLAPFALFAVVQALNAHPEWDFVYSDHDLLSADGATRFNPLFKPDWSPEIMLSANYIAHLAVIRTSLIREVGGFDCTADGAQDWELFFRITERTDRVGHIPQILYHWRASAASTAMDIWVKPYVPEAQLRVIQNHLKRIGLTDAEAYFDASGFIRVKWILAHKPLVSIIIPSRGSTPLLEKCIRSILQKTEYPNFEILIINNGENGPEAYPDYQLVASDPRVRVIHYEGIFNYSAVNNFGAREAQGDLLLFLNNDTEVLDGVWLTELVLWSQRPEIGSVGAKLLHPGHIIQHAGVIVGLTGFAGHIFAGMPEGTGSIYGFAEWYRDFLAVTAACMIVRRDLFWEVDGFDEAFTLCGSDIELNMRIHALGYRVVYNPFVKLLHVESATHQGHIPAVDFRISLDHYASVLADGDPYFNSNLSYWHTHPTLTASIEENPLVFAQNFVVEHGPGAEEVQ